MIQIRICIGSSCYLGGSRELIDLFENEIISGRLEDKIELAGSFCVGECSHTGTSVVVDGKVYTEVTREGFNDFWNEKVLPLL